MRNTATNLHLLPTPEREPRPPFVPSAHLPRRPGERREPITLLHPPDPLAAAAAVRGLDLGCATELCLERALVMQDLVECGASELYPRILEMADRAEVHAALPPAKSRYLQMLLAARARSFAENPEAITEHAAVDVPLRLFPRVVEIAATADFSPQALDEAVRLEVAATSAGRLMSEWALLRAFLLRR